MNDNLQYGTTSGDMPRSRGRWLVIAPLLMLFSFTVQMDKTNMSVVIADHAFLHALDLSGKPAHIGLLNSLFVTGYGIGMLLWGFVIDWIGPRRSAMIGACGWGVFTLACGWTTNVNELYVARALLGAFEGCLWPLANTYVGRWFPSQERSRITGCWVGSAFVAIAVGIPIVTAILLALNWRGVFISLGIYSFMLVPLFYLFGSDEPARSRFANAAEADFIRRGAPQAIRTADGSQPTLFQSLANFRIFLLILVHASSSAILWGLTTWLPTYLVRERGLSMKSMSGVISISYIAPILLVVLVGYLADKARHRAWVGALVAIGTMIALTVAMSVPWVLVTAFLLVLAIAAPMIFGGLHSAMLHDYVPHGQLARSTGIVVGFGNILGSFSPAAMGYLAGVFGGKFLLAFVMIIGLNALSLLIYVVIALLKQADFIAVRNGEPNIARVRSRP